MRTDLAITGDAEDRSKACKSVDDLDCHEAPILWGPFSITPASCDETRVFPGTHEQGDLFLSRRPWYDPSFGRDEHEMT